MSSNKRQMMKQLETTCINKQPVLKICSRSVAVLVSGLGFGCYCCCWCCTYYSITAVASAAAAVAGSWAVVTVEVVPELCSTSVGAGTASAKITKFETICRVELLVTIVVVAADVVVIAISVLWLHWTACQIRETRFNIDSNSRWCCCSLVNS